MIRILLTRNNDSDNYNDDEGIPGLLIQKIDVRQDYYVMLHVMSKPRFKRVEDTRDQLSDKY